MNRADTIAFLMQHKPEPQRRLAVVRLAPIGSRARDQVRDTRDADILFARP